MSRRIFLLALLSLAIESCQGVFPFERSERGFPNEITGKDGAPMMLVSAGEFLYGDNNQRMSLPAFYMDKYELTTSRMRHSYEPRGERNRSSGTKSARSAMATGR